MMFSFFLAILLVNAAKYDGSAKTADDDGFSYLAKFCATTVDSIQDTAASIETTLTYPKNGVGNFQLVLYYDGEKEGVDDAWQEARDKKCQDNAWSKYMNNNVSVEWKEDGDKWTFQHTFPVTETQRPHFWYIALVDCDRSQDADMQSVDWEIHAWQTEMGSWNKEFSFEVHGINSLYLAFMLFYFITCGLQVYATKMYQGEGGVHHVIKLLTMTLMLQTLAIVLFFVNYAGYAGSGEDIKGVLIMAQLFNVFSTTCFLMLLLLMSQGWMISSNTVSYGKAILCGCVMFAGCQIGFFFWRLFVNTKEETKYYYKSAPQIMFACSFMVVGFIFVGSSVMSWREENDPDKQWLYKTLACLFFIWFGSPIIAIIIAAMVSPWVADIVVVATWETTTFLWYSIMMFLLWPSRAGKYFEIDFGSQASYSSGGKVNTGYEQMPESL